jgi:uncharacterized surface protein with fasciclin (FAS1) repeats
MYQRLVLVFCLTSCGSPPAETPHVTAPPVATTSGPAPAAAPARPKTEAERTVVDIAVGSPDHTTLVTAVQAAGLVDALNSPGGIYTVFAPTNAAFAALPPGTVEGLLEPEAKADLKRILQHHAAVPIVPVDQMKDGQVMSMSDGTSVTLHVSADGVKVEDAKILGSVMGMNGVVHVVDKVILPPAKP